MDYETKPLSRAAIRNIASYMRRVFGVYSDNEPFPVLYALEKLPDLFKGTTYKVVEDDKLPGNIYACCYFNPEGGFVIEIKETVYNGAYYNNNGAFLCFICHEICHVILFYLGYTPISAKSFDNITDIPPYKSVEWQAKALCGEITIPFDATAGMSAKEIVAKYNVSLQSARYRTKQK